MDSDLRQQLNQHQYYGGMSRTAMTGGVPSEAMGLLIITGTLLFMWFRSFQLLSIPAVLWLICWLICLKDPDLIKIYFVWILEIGRNANKKYWRARSYMP